jgi:hypothetical protein
MTHAIWKVLYFHPSPSITRDYCSSETVSNAGGSVAAGRVTHTPDTSHKRRRTKIVTQDGSTEHSRS